MNGYTVKSISSDGVYFMVRDWRKNKAIWVSYDKLKPEYLYKSANTCIKALEKLLNAMSEYAEDKLSVVYIDGRDMTERGKLSVKNVSNDEWKNDYRVTL